MLARDGNAWLAGTTVTYRALVTYSQATLDMRLAMPSAGSVCFAFHSGFTIVVNNTGGSWFTSRELYANPWDEAGSKQAPTTTVYWTGKCVQNRQESIK
jgi:hypothetical protein